MECRHSNHPKHNTTRIKVKTKARTAYNADDIYEDTYDEQREYEQEEEDTLDEPCTFILDSCAHPTHLTSPTRHMRKTTTQKHTHTATNTRPKCTHNGKKTIITNRNVPVQLPAVANQAITTNLISVHDIT